MKNKVKKEVLFNRFSKNLQHVKSALNLHFEDLNEINGYICPLSFDFYTFEGLSNKFDDSLTLEHVPPQSLGGAGITLTNKGMNNKSGHSYDLALDNFVNKIEFKLGLAALPTGFRINNNITMRGEISKKEQLHFHFKTKSIHEGVRRFIELWENQKKIDLEFSIRNRTGANLAFLRTAYLLAFAEFGYSFLFWRPTLLNLNAELIRRQIQNPDSNLIPNIPIIQNDQPNSLLGAKIVYEPKELRSIIVTFDLITKAKKHRFSVILPGPQENAFEVFDYCKTALERKQNLNFQYYDFEESLDITKYEDATIFLKIWEEMLS